ncbi:AfsA-related hotdog domain-containing protein [Streptomyces ovatisporus]|uniref:AfsA-related hotdog domain-containing protein n=1 Tax=Streptomyces ovatisporus TaxID=1128682 RepID=A0ABV9ADJ8_9ACTN
MTIVPRPSAVRTQRPGALPASLLGPHHLVHRPDTPEAFLLQSTPPVQQQFAFSAELPGDHPLFCDGTAAFHDLLFAVESLRQTAVFAARRCFRIPESRHMVLTSGTTDITDIEPWRRTPGSAQIALDLRITPANVVNGIPHNLVCRAAVDIGGERCGTADARIAFPTPLVHRHHWNKGRPESAHHSAAAHHGAPSAHHSPAPERIGRRSSRNVLIGVPAESAPGTQSDGLTFPVDLLAARRVLPDAADAFTSALFLEVSRQAALFTATELHGFKPAHAVFSHWQASFRGFTEPGLPLYCTVRPAGGAAPAGLRRDEQQRPVADFQLAYTQGGRLVSESSVSVLQDC